MRRLLYFVMYCKHLLKSLITPCFKQQELYDHSDSDQLRIYTLPKNESTTNDAKKIERIGR